MIEEKIENLFEGPARYAGLGFFIFGILGALSGGFILGGIVSLIGAYVFFSYSGAIIDPTDRSVKAYTASFGLFKSGKWESFQDYPDIAVLMKKVKQTNRGGIAHTSSFSDTKTDYNVFLLSADHRTKLQLASKPSLEEAETYAKQLAEKTGLKFTTFNPQISYRTRMRRR